MTFKKGIFEFFLQIYASITQATRKIDTSSTVNKSFFIIRNNDIGDLLIITPLFESIKKNFPDSRITVGIGKWNSDVIKNNPFIDNVIYLSAPWHNKYLKNQSIISAIQYCFFSKEVKEIRNQKFDIGIDILGSQFGSLLMVRSKIPFKMGVKGYAEGYTVCSKYVIYDERKHVCEAALENVKLLGGILNVSPKPQIFLNVEEQLYGADLWKKSFTNKKINILIAPGAGLEEKCWPENNFKEIVKLLEETNLYNLILLGSADDFNKSERIKNDSKAINLCGKLSLRDSFALISFSDIVICNSSMIMHVAGAFLIPTFVMLSDFYTSSEMHRLQWGHKNMKVLGSEEGTRDNIFTPSELIKLLTEVQLNQQAIL